MRVPLLVATLWAAVCAVPAGGGDSPVAAYRSALSRDGASLRERSRVLRALHADERTAEQHEALVDSLSAHVHRSRPQVLDDFRDPSHRVEIPPAPHLDYTDAFSYSLWIRLEAPLMVRETKLVSHAGVQTGKVTLMGDGRRVLLLLRRADGSELCLRTVEEIRPHEWTHLGVAFSRTRDARIYIDGRRAGLRVLRGDPDARGPLLSVPAQEIYVGGLDRAFPGSVDEFRLYDRPLSGREFRTLAEGQDVVRGLAGWWPFDGTGARVARDATPHRHDARIGTGVRTGGAGRAGACVSFARDPEAWRRHLDDLQQRIDAIEAAAARLPGAAGAADVPPPDALLRRLDREGAILVHYAPGAEPGTMDAWILDPRADEPVARHGLRTPPAWHAALDALRNELRSPDPDAHGEARARAAARTIAVFAWDPVADEIDPARDVWLRVPEFLHDIPFACLVDRDGRYLAERYAFARCGPLASVAGVETTGGRPGGRAIAIVNPSPGAVDADHPDAEAATGDARTRTRAGDDACTLTATPLYGTRVEAETIAPLLRAGGFDPVETCAWAGAQESRVEAMVAGAAVVHVAAHGYRIDADCLPATPRDPLCLSGVVLAGTARLLPDHARGAHEGLLSAAEVSHLDLSSARLVAWSGCATADGARGDDSLRGLAAAAWLAGAGCSVATLWDVPDLDMPATMRAFYTAWTGGASPARAARDAQRAAMKASQQTYGHRHPARWASLTVEGVR